MAAAHGRLCNRVTACGCVSLQGYLLPSYHRFYWLGLAVVPGAQWPTFTWSDYTPGPNATSYNHWGRSVPGNVPEPNNYDAPELCAGANASEAFSKPAAWGWADAPCTEQHPYVCRKMRGWRAHLCTLHCCASSVAVPVQT